MVGFTVHKEARYGDFLECCCDGQQGFYMDQSQER